MGGGLSAYSGPGPWTDRPLTRYLLGTNIVCDLFRKALQGVRERAMDMTGWLEYFTEGLGAQMRDVQVTADHEMRRDVILAKARKNGMKGLVREAGTGPKEPTKYYQPLL